VVSVRGEDAGCEQCLRDDGGVPTRLRVVQGLVQGRAGPIPATEFHEGVPLTKEDDGSHRTELAGGLRWKGRKPSGIRLDRRLPLLVPLELARVVQRLRKRVAIGIWHNG